AFEKAGFWIGRQGKHVIMYNGSRTLIIPRHNPIKSFTLIGIVKSAGLTVDEFRKLL
ncbi:MAG TPA: type II toxin-antitoxin system HicA family toxin, partial [Acidobacteriaceae bacterium]|nr:type II toxin-antitoxin system HicA family toxin [Acidobacteriaceae bacterium]